MEPPPFPQTSCNCEWHTDIQSSLGEVKNHVTNHQQQVLTEEQTKRNYELVKKFVWFKGQKGKIWKQIEKFCCKPSVFQMRDIQLHIEDDFSRSFPQISDEELKEKVRDLGNNIEDQIRKDFRQKYKELSEQKIRGSHPDKSDEEVNEMVRVEINKKVREVKVRGYLTGDREKYVSDKAEFLVEDAICKIMFHKPGLLRRGLKTAKVTYQHLKKILGDITPNCSGGNCKHHKPMFPNGR